MKYKGALPKGDSDGLSSLEAIILKQSQPVVAVVILEEHERRQMHDTKEWEVTMRMRRVEALLPDDVEAATRLLQRSFESRTGESTLPIELENDINDALKGVATYVPETEQLKIEVPEEGGYAALTVTKLTALLKQRGLDHSKGTKTELIGRLETADMNSTAEPENVVQLFNDGTVPSETVDEGDVAWNAAAPAADAFPPDAYTEDPEEPYEP